MRPEHPRHTWYPTCCCWFSTCCSRRIMSEYEERVKILNYKSGINFKENKNVASGCRATDSVSLTWRVRQQKTAGNHCLRPSSRNNFRAILTSCVHDCYLLITVSTIFPPSGWPIIKPNLDCLLKARIKKKKSARMLIFILFCFSFSDISTPLNLQ